MPDDNFITMDNEELDQKLNSLYKSEYVHPYIQSRVQILLSEKSRRELRYQSKVNSKISIRSQRIALIALFISIIFSVLLMFFTWNDNRLDKKRFEVLTEIRDIIQDVSNDN